MVDQIPAKRSVTEVVKKSFSLYFKKPVFILIALIPLVVQLVFSYFIYGQLSSAIPLGSFTSLLGGQNLTLSINGTDTNSTSPLGGLVNPFDTIYSVIGLIILTVVVNYVVYAVTTAALMVGAKHAITGSKPRLGSMLKHGFKKIGKLFAGLLLMLLVVSPLIIGVILVALFGFIPLMLALGLFALPVLIGVPALIILILVLLFAYYVPVLILEDKGVFKSFKHAFKVGKKNLLITFKFMIVMSLVTAALAFIPYQMYVASLLTVPVSTIALALLYMRGAKKV